MTNSIVTEKTKLYSTIKFEVDSVVGEKKLLNDEFLQFKFQFKNDCGMSIHSKEKYLELLEFFKMIINEENNTK